MERRKLFGSHLYSQIVLPLLAASFAVALIATAVAVYFLRDLTDKWVSEVADAITTSVVDRCSQYASSMTRDVRIVAENRGVARLAAGEASTSPELSLIRESAALGFDNLMVVDSSGEVIASSGWSEVQPGATPLDQAQLAAARGTEWGRSVFLPIANRYTL